VVTPGEAGHAETRRGNGRLVDRPHAAYASLHDRVAYLDALEDLLTGYCSKDPAPRGLPFRVEGFSPEYRDEGLDWPSTALTMVGRRRLPNFRELIERAIDEGVPGDILEAGVWRGGASILARAVPAAHGVTDMRIIVADSFARHPPPSDEFPADAGATFHTHADLAGRSRRCARTSAASACSTTRWSS
jgi:hypothetical protein